MNIEATRAALLAQARAHFATRGYSKAELGQIAGDAGLTTGAIYHHFASKAGLFRAVAEQLETDILAAAAIADDPDPLARLRRGFENLIDLCARPDVQRIIFIEAPQVLGPEAWREIELRYALGALRAVLTDLGARGIIPPFPADLLARLLLALLREASAEVARSDRDPEVRAQISALTSSVLDGVFGPA